MIRVLFGDDVAVLQILFHKLVARKRILIDRRYTEVVGNDDAIIFVARAAVKAEINTVVNKRIFDRDRDTYARTLLAVQQKGYGDIRPCISVCRIFGRNRAVFVNGSDILSRRRKFNLCAIGEVGVEDVIQGHLLGGIHRNLERRPEYVFAACKSDCTIVV